VNVPDQLSRGGIWAETNTSATGDLTFSEMIDFIEPQAERTCVPVPGFPVCADDQTQGTPVTLPARSGAIMQSTDDWGKNKTALEQLCRQAGSSCSYEAVQSATQKIAKLGKAKP